MKDWGAVFQNAALFLPVVRAVYAREGLGEPPPLRNLTPGTNAVFRCGERVVKLFAPEGTAFYAPDDFAVECAMLCHAAEKGVAAPAPRGQGMVEAYGYAFNYLVMDYVAGTEAGDMLPALAPAEKYVFALKMRALLEKLHRPCVELPEVDLARRALENPRLTLLPEGIAGELRARASILRWGPNVAVHGDVTGENVLIMPDGSPCLIDFADSVAGPALYELPALIFELFRCDREMVRAFAGDEPLETFVDALLDGFSFHLFSPGIIADFTRRTGIRPTTLDDLRNALLEMWRV